MKALLGSSLRLLLRDWRGGELGVLFSALILAVSLVVGISGFVNRLQINLERESSRFLAADLVVATADRTPESFISRAAESGLARGEDGDILVHGGLRVRRYVLSVRQGGGRGVPTSWRTRDRGHQWAIDRESAKSR